MEISHYIKLIENYYKNDVAERTQVPLIYHIHEGIKILNHLGASPDAIKAFCIHPMFQGDDVINASSLVVNDMAIELRVLLLVMEYRKCANSYLPYKELKKVISPTIPKIVMVEVKHMLIADKVQNRKDFKGYHTYAEMGDRYPLLNIYFILWLRHLEISEDQYISLCELIASDKDSRSFDEWYVELGKVAKSHFKYSIVPCKEAWEDYYNEGFQPYDAIYDDAYNGI